MIAHNTYPYTRTNDRFITEQNSIAHRLWGLRRMALYAGVLIE